MVYMGSKNRIAKDLIAIMEPYFSKEKMYYEPFVGGANMIDKIPKDKVKGLVGNDMNKYLIALLKKMQSDDDIPYNFIEKEDWVNNYLHQFKKGILDMVDWEIGYLGFTKTFSGQFMCGYSGIFKRKEGRFENYQKEKHNNIINQRNYLKGIHFKNGPYDALNIEDNSIVYLDPPYKDTSKYEDIINYEYFFEWVEMLYGRGCIIFMSEYQAPPEFECLFEKELKSKLTSKINKQTEKLFIYRGKQDA